MPAQRKYKVIRGTDQEVEAQLNDLAKYGWRPVAMAHVGIPNHVAVILENPA